MDRVYAIGVAVLLSSATSDARADVYNFNFTPLPSFSEPLDPLSFSLDTSQAPSSFGPVFNGITFYYDNVNVLSDGVTYGREVGFGQFLGDYTGYNTYAYQFGVGQSVIVNAGSTYIGSSSPRAGGQVTSSALFTGTAGAPVFVPGVYTIPVDGILTITDQTPTVTPEPSSLALLGTGVLGVAGLLRRRGSRA